jgi:flagellar biosynthetic protein FlhB
MAEVDGQEKTEQPSGKKLNDSREDGKTAKSQEVNSLAVFVTGLMMIYATKNFIGNRIADYTVNIFNSLDTLSINENFVQNFFKENFLFLVLTIAPVIGAIMVMGMVAGFGQVGFKITPKAMKPELKKFNPISGMKKFVSVQSLVEVTKSLLKLALIGGFTYTILADLIVNSANMMQLSLGQIVGFLVDASYSLLWKISLLYAVIAAADFVYQKRKFKKDMMMTKQEVKEEHKQTDGDPFIKGKIRKIQMQAARNRMIQNVPKADVVITNPTHYAIALKYDMANDAAPIILAKGIDEVAQRIKKVAAEHNIPLHEDRQLARTLYKVCEVGDHIPAELFKAVAQILAYVFKLKSGKYKKSII